MNINICLFFCDAFGTSEIIPFRDERLKSDEERYIDLFSNTIKEIDLSGIPMTKEMAELLDHGTRSYINIQGIT